MSNFTNLNYDELYEKILSIVGLQISNFEQLSLLFHCILLKKGFKGVEKESVVNDDWNKESSKCIFRYLNQTLEYELQILDKTPLELQFIGRKSIYSDPTLKNKLSINQSDIKIDFTKINETISDLEELVSNNLLNSRRAEPPQNNFNPFYDNRPTNNYPTYINPNPYNPESIFDPNPFFNSGGIGGGNLVGPNSNIFNPNRPRLAPRYDIIGPFGNFGGPEKKKDPFGRDNFGGSGGFI
jgi:hypothetical protein